MRYAHLEIKKKLLYKLGFLPHMAKTADRQQTWQSEPQVLSLEPDLQRQRIENHELVNGKLTNEN